VVRVEDALKRLTRMLGGPDWHNLLAFLPPGLGDERVRRSALAAHLAASLELTRAGMIEVSQASPFGPIYLRRRR
jgi:segregation and condensation protein A